MKREIYNLTDEPFAVFVNKVGTVLKDNGVEHSVVGGVSVQAHMLDMLTNKYHSDVYGLVHNPSIRMQDYLRSTDDVDLSLKLNEETDMDKIRKINSVLPDFACEDLSPRGESIIEIKHERNGASRPTFRVYVDDKGNEQDVISMNITRNKHGGLRHLSEFWYDEIIKQSQELTIPYVSNYNLNVRVPKLEHVLSTKISASRAKDLMDIKNLVDLAKGTNKEINLDELENILLPENQKHYFSFLGTHYPERLGKHGFNISH